MLDVGAIPEVVALLNTWNFSFYEIRCKLTSPSGVSLEFSGHIGQSNRDFFSLIDSARNNLYVNYRSVSSKPQLLSTSLRLRLSDGIEVSLDLK